MLRYLSLLGLTALLYSCIEDMDVVFPIVEEPNPGPTIEARADLFIRLVDEENLPIAGAELSLAGIGGQTDENGRFVYLDFPVALSGVEFNAEAEGYIPTQTRVYAAAGGQTTFELVLLEKGSLSTFSTQETMFFADPNTTSSIRIEANSMETLDGQPYTGMVSGFVRYLDPLSPTFTRLQPAGMQAVALDGSEGQLASFGMIYFEIKGENGEALQSNAPLRISIQAGNEVDLRPESIDLWTLQLEDDAWQEIDLSAGMDERTYFSTLPVGCCFGELVGWINCDIKFPSEAAIFKITDLQDIPLRQIMVQVYSSDLGLVFNNLSNNLGEAALQVPLNEDFTLRLQTACGDFISEHSIAAVDLATYNELQTTIANPDDWWQVVFTGEDCNQDALDNGFVLTRNVSGYYTLSQLQADGTVEVLVPKCGNQLGFFATAYSDPALTQAGMEVSVVSPGFQQSITLPVCP
ncbi:MAG: carboxypeptidase-like regulatory domain-containing protein [Bacteroidota bacterium]